GYLYDSNFKLSVIRKLDSNDYYEIPARQMKEFRIMCNPEIELKQYLSDQEARMKPGSRVFVKFGPLKGLSGRLVRISKKYYLLKEVPGMAVALKVGRWCCVPEVEMQALQTAKTI
ncbi:MAG: UpdY protein, partial [Prevotella sp.]|nr:UpdY protein [Prevotella sp.]